MARPATVDHKPSQPKPETWGDPAMPMLKQEQTNISCSCGWMKFHLRTKVREDAAQAHLDKRHGGQGLWL